jgi:hypothetical protein
VQFLSRLLSLLALLLLPALAACASPQGWRLDQLSDFSGKQSITWCQDAVCISCERYGLTVLIKKPNWQVTVYSTDSQKYCQLSYEQFKKSFCSHRRAHIHGRLYVGAKATHMFGLKVTQYYLTVAKLRQPYSQILKHPSKLNDYGEWSEIWLTKDLHMPNVVADVLSALAGVPSDCGLPLRIIRMRSSGVGARTIDTIGYHHITLAQDQFKVPPHLKLVKDEVAIFLEDDPDTSMESQVDSLTKASKKQGWSETSSFEEIGRTILDSARSSKRSSAIKK